MPGRFVHMDESLDAAAVRELHEETGLPGMGIPEKTDRIEQDVSHRAARLYRFDETRYRELVKQGVHFEI